VTKIVPPNGKTIPCSQCGTPIYRAKWALEKNANHFCSRQCKYEHQKGKPGPNKGKTAETHQGVRNSVLNRQRGETITCIICGKQKYKRPSRIDRAENQFCSQECYYEWIKENPTRPKNGRYVNCSYCGKEIYRIQAHLKISKKFYCSHECHGNAKREDPNISFQMRKARMKAKGKYPKANTSIELKLQKILKSEKIKFQTDKAILEMTRVDIFISPNICIYADGDYWHSLPEVQERDQRITETLTNYGFEVLRFKGSEIHGDIGKCLRIVKDNIKKRERLPH